MCEQKTFGEYLRNTRKLVGISQLDLAEAIGVSNVLIHRLEHDLVKNPQHEDLMKLETFFKMKKGELSLKYQSFLKRGSDEVDPELCGESYSPQ